MLDARAEEIGAGALDDSVVEDRFERELRRREQLRKALVVVLIGVRDHGSRDFDPAAGFVPQIEAPAEKTEHAVRLAGVDQHERAGRRHDEGAIALSDIHEVDLEEPLLLHLGLLQPARLTARSDLGRVTVVFVEALDEIAPDQLLRLGAVGVVTNEWRRVGGKWHGISPSEARTQTGGRLLYRSEDARASAAHLEGHRAEPLVIAAGIDAVNAAWSLIAEV